MSSRSAVNGCRLSLIKIATETKLGRYEIRRKIVECGETVNREADGVISSSTLL